MARKAPDVSVVVIGYRMERELPRTLRSLSPAMQRGIKAEQYEIILIDNGSPAPMPLDRFPTYGAQVSCHWIENASASPAAAANFGLKQARGRLIGVMVDGARLASPGLLTTALLAEQLDERPVISSLGFHLGFMPQMESLGHGYSQTTEDALLDAARWTEDGYRLFDIAALAGSSEAVSSCRSASQTRFSCRAGYGVSSAVLTSVFRLPAVAMSISMPIAGLASYRGRG
jgi:glycosyltransferase involved in cell wall biosynthesis